MNKKKALKLLRQSIIKELFADQWHEVRFFPEKFDVKGWQGTAPIVFVGLNPSGGGHFPSRADQFFYKCLADNKFHNAHITDVYKKRATGSDVPKIQGNKLLLRLNRKYLLKEIAILKPHLMVALGKAAYDLLNEWFPDMPKERLCRISHYAYASRWGKKDRFSKEMGGVRERYLKLPV